MAETFYPSEQAAVTALLPGYKVVGRQKHMVTATNPKRDPAHPDEPQNVSTQDGWELSLQGPNGEPETMVVSDIKTNPSSVGGPKGGVGLTVIEGPKNKPTAVGSKPGDMVYLDKNFNTVAQGSKDAVYVKDPKSPPGTQPLKLEGASGLGDPSTWIQVRRDQADPASPVVALFDPKSQSIAASLGAEPNAKPTGTFTNVTVNGKVVGVTDDGDKSFHPISTQDGHQVVITPNALYSFDQATNTTKLLQTLDPKQSLQGVTFPDGSVYLLDPNVTDKSTALTKLQGTQLPQTITQDGVGGTKITLVLDPATNTYGPPPGAPGARTIDTGTGGLKRIVIRDGATGEVISDTPNPNYTAPAASIPSPNTTAPFIQVQDPNDPSKLIWVENKGRVTASEALKQQASYLSGQVVSGDITVDEAKAIIDAANARMTNDINKQNADTSSATQVQGAANDILSNVRGNATTGANVLANRTQAATSGLSSILGLASGGKLGNVPGDVGSNLVNGLTGWSAELMGGQGTLDSAARMVQAADPQSNFYDPSTQKAVGVLAQMLDKYQEVTGGPHPAHASLQAQAASAGGNGFGAPDTSSGLQQGQQTTGGIAQALAAQQQANAQAAGVGGQPGTAQLNSLGLNDNFQGRQVAAGQTPTIPNAPPRLPGMYDPAWSQAFRSPVGSISTGPNAANGFVAPPPAAPLAPQTAGGVTINVGR